MTDLDEHLTTLLASQEVTPEAQASATAVRERVAELEATIREELCNCGPTDNPDLGEHADYCRARRVLERGGDDG